MMKYTKLLAWMLVMILAFGVVGCSDDDDGDPAGPSKTNHFTEAAELGIAYFNDYSNAMITASTVYENILNEVDMFIIDWRGASDYAEGHIAGAVNWAPADLVDNLDQLPVDGTLIVNVCYSGQSASQITAAMHLLGYDNARNMGYGMCSWTERAPWSGLTSYGYGLETTSNTMTEVYDYPTSLEMDVSDLDLALQQRIDEYFSGSMGTMTAETVYNMIADDEDIFVLNYWPVAAYEAGHVPGAYQLEMKTWSMDVLAMLPTEKPVIVYCYTGQTSSQVTAWLRILGYDAYSVLFGMNKINNTHPNNSNYVPPTDDRPVVGG